MKTHDTKKCPVISWWWNRKWRIFKSPTSSTAWTINYECETISLFVYICVWLKNGEIAALLMLHTDTAQIYFLQITKSISCSFPPKFCSCFSHFNDTAATVYSFGSHNGICFPLKQTCIYSSLAVLPYPHFSKVASKPWVSHTMIIGRLVLSGFI